jgi:hypothetical protein
VSIAPEAAAFRKEILGKTVRLLPANNKFPLCRGTDTTPRLHKAFVKKFLSRGKKLSCLNAGRTSLKSATFKLLHGLHTLLKNAVKFRRRIAAEKECVNARHSHSKEQAPEENDFFSKRS